MLAFLAVAGLLAGVWWLSLRALDLFDRLAAPSGDAGINGTHILIKQWGSAGLTAPMLRALLQNDLAALDQRYGELKAVPPVSELTADDRIFEESLVSLALAEATADVAKAHRGLEAVRRLRCGLSDGGQNRRLAVLDVIEARLRLVLADTGHDGGQRALAMAALERASASGQSVG